MTLRWYGTGVLELTYKNSQGMLASQLVYREDEARLVVEEDNLPWSFDADGDTVRLASEAYRINLAHLFDPYLAVHTSSIEPLPHQISAVYQEMLPRLPLRYILADDPGAGKTIMTGLLLKELIVRGDLKRCLIVSPGSLSEQWQDELYNKFHLKFDILTNDRFESAVSGNVFGETNLCIVRLDKISRNELLQEKLKATEWDLIVVDEAHKMSATVWGNEVKYTKRFLLGRLLSNIKESDKKGVSPGSVALKNLFDACGPCLVLMDELVAYAKKIYGIEGLPAGSFDNFISFIQEITEAASASKNSMVVASIPESNVEIGGEAGQKALEAIEHTYGRKESIWKPVAASEGFEVVRRRLFLDCKKPAERDKVCAAFSQMYQDNPMDFPVSAKEIDYRDRMISCYPIHPEIFDELYQEWATLEHFQRTRGVLRLMAAVIHELWMAGDGSAMIMPGSLPLHIPTVKDELVRYLPETWNAIIDSEVDGKKSVPYQLDNNNPRYGNRLAARRVARTIMLGSAPTVRAQNVRGIEASRIRLGVIQPGENIANFNDALNTLRGSLSYLYADSNGNRYWYDTKPTLFKTAQDRSSQISSSEVEYEIERRLRDLRKEAPFAAIHICPASSGDVYDEQAVRLVILRPEDTYKQGKMDSAAIRKAEEILNNRGSAPRTYRNMLAFVAPDHSLLPSLQKAVRDLLAWESIKTDSIRLNLDAAQNAETANSIARCNDTVISRLKEVYCWLIVPSIDSSADMRTIIWDTDKLVGVEPIVSKAAVKMQQNEQIITKWAPALLKMELDKLLWKDENHIQVKKLWEYLTTYCYLPRLANFQVLDATIRAGVASDESFAIASGFNGERYTELRYNVAVSDVYPTDYLVKVLAALKQITKGPDEGNGGATAPAGNPQPGNGGTTPPVSGGNPPVVNPPAVGNKHFFMSVKLDNTRVIRDLQRYLDEVINHLSSTDNCEVELSLEVNAQAVDGFSQGTVRTVSENCRTLRVDNFGFDN